MNSLSGEVDDVLQDCYCSENESSSNLIFAGTTIQINISASGASITTTQENIIKTNAVNVAKFDLVLKYTKDLRIYLCALLGLTTMSRTMPDHFGPTYASAVHGFKITDVSLSTDSICDDGATLSFKTDYFTSENTKDDVRNYYLTKISATDELDGKSYLNIEWDTEYVKMPYKTYVLLISAYLIGYVKEYSASKTACVVIESVETAVSVCSTENIEVSLIAEEGSSVDISQYANIDSTEVFGFKAYELDTSPSKKALIIVVIVVASTFVLVGAIGILVNVLLFKRIK
ncbi:MAG: hypothetical protein IKT96_01900, partial [Paludibacteraceae bacterium]|nr:hypothetical protein [Paludibacteraceae bacterium]